MTGRAKVDRPLSPHLTIYRPQLTSVLSIMHRITGVGLVISLSLIVMWFVALALGPEIFGYMEIIFKSIFLRIILAFSIGALWYHTFTGIRHLIWDMGYGLEVEWITPSAYLVLFCSVLFTLLTLYAGSVSYTHLTLPTILLV